MDNQDYCVESCVSVRISVCFVTETAISYVKCRDSLLMHRTVLLEARNITKITASYFYKE
jgi:hypothetical protein